MRLTIVNDDNFVSIDGQGINFDISSMLDSNIHAVQWYDTHGEIEFKRQIVENRIVVPPNEYITEETQFQNIINAYRIEKARQEEEKVKMMNTETQLQQNELQ